MRSFLRSIVEEVAASGERSVRPRVQAMGVDLILLVLVLFFGIATACVMGVALYLLLVRVLPSWLAALLLGALLLCVTAVLVLLFRARGSEAGASSETGQVRGTRSASLGVRREPGVDVPHEGDGRASDLLGEAFERSRLGAGELVMTGLIAGLLAGRDRSRSRRARREAWERGRER